MDITIDRINRVTPFVIHPSLYLAYFLAGIATIVLGPTLPFLATRWPMQDALAGSLFVAQFGGGIAGAILSTRFPRASFLMGCCLTAVAIASVGWAPWVLAHALFFAVGMGLGSIIASGNIFATQLASSSRRSEASALAVLHLAWGMGAVSCPWLFRAAMKNCHASLFFFFVGVAFAVLALSLLLAGPTLQMVPRNCEDRRKTSLSRKERCYFALALLLYTGSENALSGWLPSYALRMQGRWQHMPSTELMRSASLGALAFSFLWGGVLCGRAAIAVVLRFVREQKIYGRTILALLISSALLLGLPGHVKDLRALFCVLSAACGVSLAGIYPILMARLLKQSGGTRGLGWVLASASVGGATLPWLSGIASTCFGTIRAAIVIPSMAALFLFLLVPPIYSHQRGDGLR